MQNKYIWDLKGNIMRQKLLQHHKHDLTAAKVGKCALNASPTATVWSVSIRKSAPGSQSLEYGFVNNQLIGVWIDPSDCVVLPCGFSPSRHTEACHDFPRRYEKFGRRFVQLRPSDHSQSTWVTKRASGGEFQHNSETVKIQEDSLSYQYLQYIIYIKPSFFWHHRTKQQWN